MNINVVALTGRTTSPIELKTTPTGAQYVHFDLAVQQNGKEKKTDFFRCIAWNGTAKLLAQYVGKGSEIGIQGRLTANSYTDKNGIQRTSVQVLVNDVSFENLKGVDGNNQNANANTSEPVSETGYPNANDFGISDADLPF